MSLKKVFVAFKRSDDYYPNWQDEVRKIESCFVLEDGWDYLWILIMDSYLKKLDSDDYLRYSIADYV